MIYSVTLTELFNEVKVSQIVDTDSSLNTLYSLIKGRVHHSCVVYQHIQLLVLGGEGTHKVGNALEGCQIQHQVAHLGKQLVMRYLLTEDMVSKLRKIAKSTRGDEMCGYTFSFLVITLMSSTVFLHDSSVLLAMTISAACDASSKAVERPIPVLPPVINTTLPSIAI